MHHNTVRMQTPARPADKAGCLAAGHSHDAAAIVRKPHRQRKVQLQAAAGCYVVVPQHLSAGFRQAEAVHPSATGQTQAVPPPAASLERVCRTSSVHLMPAVSGRCGHMRDSPRHTVQLEVLHSCPKVEACSQRLHALDPGPENLVSRGACMLRRLMAAALNTTCSASVWHNSMAAIRTPAHAELDSICCMGLGA